MSCSSLTNQLSDLVFIPNIDSNETNEKEIRIKIITDKSRKELKIEREKFKTQKALPLLAAPLATAAISQIQKKLKKEAEKYTASYSAMEIKDTFYSGWTQKANINVKGIMIERFIHGIEIPVMEMCFYLQPTLDEKAFQLKPISVLIRKSKAKLIAFDWLSPFNIDLLTPRTIFSKSKGGLKFPKDNDLDLTVQVNLQAIWVDKGQKGHSVDIPAKPLKVTKLALNERKDYLTAVDIIEETFVNKMSGIECSKLKKRGLYCINRQRSGRKDFKF